MTSSLLLEGRDLAKAFGGVAALRGVDFALARGEILALLGENGAGKSTLLHLAYGMTQPDRGELRVGGDPIVLASPRAARAAGIGMVHQHFTSIAALTVAENIALARGPDARPGEAGVPSALRSGLPSGARVETLSVALRQRLEIVKALATGAGILLLDEPTAVLAPSEVEQLLEQLRGFARAGGAVILVTHKLREVLAVADRVTVLRSGVVTLDGPVAAYGPDQLAEAMIGARPRPAGTLRSPAATGTAAAELIRIDEIRIHAGELVGVAAIEGNGQRELLRGIAGVEPSQPGAAGVEVRGRVAFVPEDRSTEGLIPALSVTENVVLGLLDDPRWSRGIRLDWAAARRHTAKLLERFGVRASGPDAPAWTLSGGNQQKVILARALEAGPAILVAENPTRGLDIQATAESHRRLREAAAEGVAVVFYSSDLDEVMQLGARILVVHEGRMREVPSDADRRTVGEMMLGLHPR